MFARKEETDVDSRTKPVAERPDSELVLNRRASSLRAIAVRLNDRRTSPLQICRAVLAGLLVDPEAKAFFSGLPEGEKHYWISSLYALLLPERRRSRLAVYFTPPHLSRYAIDVLVDAGIRLGTDTILDPASGGAAFLVPLAARIAEGAGQSSKERRMVLERIEKTLAGVEIEPDLGELSRALLADRLGEELAISGRRKLKICIETADALRLDIADGSYDAIIGNPPYGRIYRPANWMLKRFTPVISDGYVNLYALFIMQALRWVKPGGIVCLIVPLSFVGGAHFAGLREHILETAHVLRVDPIDKRSDVFLDVLYDVCLLVLGKRSSKSILSGVARSSLLLVDAPPRELGRIDLPAPPSNRVWAIPDGKQDDRFFHAGLETLGDYGYITKAGYFVWNREQHRYRVGKSPKRGEVPLFWAHNIRPNIECVPRADKNGTKLIGLVTIEATNGAIIRQDAIILQRTSNRRQRRRLIAGTIRQSGVAGRRGFVTENHTILILPDTGSQQRVSLEILCRLINTEAVDSRFRRMSGTVSVSTKGLRMLPLPAAADVHRAFAQGLGDEEAAALAYKYSARQNKELGPISATGRGGNSG